MINGSASRYARNTFPWCRICRRPVWRYEAFSVCSLRRIEYRTLCHGVPGRAWINEEDLLLAAAMAPAVYELAPLMLAPVPSPAPRVRGRGPSRVFLAPPIEVRA